MVLISILTFDLLVAFSDFRASAVYAPNALKMEMLTCCIQSQMVQKGKVQKLFYSIHKHFGKQCCLKSARVI